MADRLRVGLIVNPVAGIGAEAAQFGSDDADGRRSAAAAGYRARAPQRVAVALAACADLADRICFATASGVMGEDYLGGFDHEVVYRAVPPSSAADTKNAALRLLAADVELLLFAGGDGTARDLHDAIGAELPVLGIPAGVKMHSGVFVTRPQAVGELLRRLLDGGLVAARAAELRDLDEQALGRGQVRVQFFGEMKVPDFGEYLQHVKEGGVESEALATEEIVADVVERLRDLATSVDQVPVAGVLFGPGSTVARVQTSLGLPATLLGVDARIADGSYADNCDEKTLFQMTGRGRLILIASFSRGQGVLFGRGNLQLSARVLRHIARRDMWVLATRTKVSSLEGRALLVDTGDAEVDRALAGLIELTTGYEDRLYYRVADGS